LRSNHSSETLEPIFFSASQSEEHSSKMPFPKLHYDTAQDVIRRNQDTLQELSPPEKAKEWGFVIYRCTYKSQEKWDTFMSIMQELAKDFLKNEEDQDLWEKLTWTVIEDPKLDGLSWLEVNTWFAKWVEADLTRERFNHEALVDGRNLDDGLTAPELTRHEYFMYVNEEVLDSFEDIEVASDPNGSGHFFTLVSLDYVCQLQGAMDRRKRKLAGNPLPEDEELAKYWGDSSGDEMPEEMLDFPDQDTRRYYWQRFMARDLVKAYASLSMDFWLLHHELDEQEISEILHL
jgi:hypothetical protein